MAKNYEIHVISNTHWDREWLYHFQETRLQLIEMMDKLLDVLDRRPEYASFLLDSQTVPVEDYLEVRPENRNRIVEHVTNGRLLIGPWYTAPECFCVNGESLVRNLLYGHRTAREFGRVMKVGHTPFSYGQNSQMPQIYRGFGIDAMLFYHGVSHDEVPNEFIFEGADGAQILASQMSSFARYNFYFFVYRPVIYGAAIDDRTYDWRQGGCPFHLCGEAQAAGHCTLLDPVENYDLDRAGDCARQLRSMEAGVSTTRHLAFMMGHDSSAPDEREIEIIAAARDALDGDRIFHSSLPTYIEKVRKAAKDLTVLKGERRTPKPMPLIMHLYSDVLSSRTRMKRLNARAEFDLQRSTEPFAAAAAGLGAAYPHALLDMAWKTLLKCHAHDSIAGSGVDDIEQDMIYRLRQVLNISESVKRRSLEAIQRRIDNSGAAPDDVLITVFNPSPRPRTEMVTAFLDIPKEIAAREFSLRDAASNQPVPVQFVSRRPHQAVMVHLGDAKAMMEAERVAVHFEAREIPPVGYAVFVVDRTGKFADGGLVCGRYAMENEHIKVQINPNGTFDITHKAGGAVFDGLHYFEDDGEAGMAWMHLAPAYDRVVTSLGNPVAIALEENGPLLARYRIDYAMKIPASLEENGGNPSQRRDGVGNAARRSDETRDLAITSYATLRKGSPVLEVRTRFVNLAECHRLRVLFPTRSKADICSVESAFDVVERPILFGPDSPWRGSKSVTFPMQRFVDVSDGKTGLAVMNDGLREYEVTQGTERAIAVTLLRAYEVALSTVSKRWEPHPEMKGSQALGEHEFRYFIYPHKGTWDEADVFAQADRLMVDLVPAQTGRHAGELPQRYSFVELEGDAVQLSALYRAADGDELIVRLFNPTARKQEAKLVFARPVRHAEVVSLEEKTESRLDATGRSVRVRLGRKKILTLRVALK